VTSHDQLFKTLFQSFLTDLLSLAEPEALDFLDLPALRLLDKETFTGWPEARRREVDLLALAPARSRPEERFLVHVEIERSARSTMGHRLWGYANLLQGRYGVPVLTVLVNLRGGPAGARQETVRKGTPYREVSTFRYTTFGLSGCRAEDYLDRPEPLAWGLAALMRPGRLSRAELKIECLRRLARARLDTRRTLLLVECVQTYLQLNAEEAREYDILCSLDTNQEVQAMETMWWGDRVRLEGLEQGRKEGLREGRAAARQILLQLLAQRFGRVPARIRRQVEAIESLDRLSQLAGRVYAVGSLAELGLGEP
jgi:hypothetical protein